MDRANGSLTGILSSVAAFCWICSEKAIAAMQRTGAVSSREAPGLSDEADQRARSVIAVMDCSNVRVVPPKIICQSQECV